MITRENAKELLPIIKAYSEGKEIEFLNLGNKWKLLTDPNFDGEPFQYRIKPETKYRKFKSIKECWEEMQKHQPFGWVKHTYKPKNEDRYYFINLIDDETDFDYLFKTYTFADGTPYGIKEEE